MSSPVVIDAIRRLAGPAPDEVSDADLLNRYIASRDGMAFEALVHRYGGLVWGACRRRLRDGHLAEDAFQTTFLALARHAATLRRQDALGAWLHRTAVRCSAALRTPRNSMPVVLPDLPDRSPDPMTSAAKQDLERVVDAEIDALPEPFRQTFIVCEVEQRTASAAAKQLGCPVGTIESRLTRARQRLRERLGRRGVTAGAIAGFAFSADAAPAAARCSVVAMATGASPVPAAMAAAADHAVRVGIGTILGIGVAVASSLGVIGAGGLVWALLQAPAVDTPTWTAPPLRMASADLPIPELDQFRRNRFNFPLPPEAIARVGDPWLRHGSTPTKVAFAGNGKFLAAGAPSDRWLRVWDTTTGRPRTHVPLAADEVLVALALTGDGGQMRALIHSGAERMLHLREYDTFRGIEIRRRLIENGPAETAVFAADGWSIAVLRDGLLRVIDAGTTKELWRQELERPVQRVEVCFAAAGDRLAVAPAGSDRVRFLNATSGRLEFELTDDQARLSMLAFSRDGQHLAAWCSNTQRIRVWDLRSRAVVRSISPGFPLASISCAPEGEAIVGLSPSRPFVSWSAKAGVPPRFAHASAGGMHAWFSPDGAKLAVATMNGTLQLFEARTLTALAGSPLDVTPPQPAGFAGDGRRLLVEHFQAWIDYPIDGDDALRGFVPGIGPKETSIKSAGDRAAISPDRTLIARCTIGDQNLGEFGIDLLDAASGAARGRIETTRSTRLPAFAPDGQRLYAMCSDGFLRGWNVADGREVFQAPDPCAGHAARVLVSATGKYLAVAQMVFGVGPQTDSIRVLDAATGKSLFTANGMRGAPRVAFSPDGRWFAAAVRVDNDATAHTEMRVWEAASGRLRCSVTGYDGQPAFSPDCRTLAVTQENGVVLLEVATGRPRHVFQHHGKVEPALAWRADGRVLAASSPEAPIYLWDVTGERTATAAAWDAAADDGRWLALNDNDALKAFQSLRFLWTHPSQAIAFLKSRVDMRADVTLAARACEALELIGTRDARTLLVEWATAGPPSCAIAREASESLVRMQQSW